MIPLTRLKGGALFLNADLVAMVEEHHDTVILLTDGTRLVVHETAQQVVDAVIRYRAKVLALTQQLVAEAPAARSRSAEDGDALVLTLRPGKAE